MIIMINIMWASAAAAVGKKLPKQHPQPKNQKRKGYAYVFYPFTNLHAWLFNNIKYIYTNWLIIKIKTWSHLHHHPLSSSPKRPISWFGKKRKTSQKRYKLSSAHWRFTKEKQVSSFFFIFPSSCLPDHLDHITYPINCISFFQEK